MKPLTKSLLLIVVVTIYSLLFLATKRVIPCEGSCQSLYSLDTLLTKKFDYVYGTFGVQVYQVATRCVFM